MLNAVCINDTVLSGSQAAAFGGASSDGFVYRRINGESPISTMDELAIRQALDLAGE